MTLPATITETVKTLRANDWPILVGPFRSELGFETTYWLPFLAWLAKQVPTFAARAIVVTRGGLAPLYAGLAQRSVDLYTLRSVVEVRRANLLDQRRTGIQKQIAGVTAWDEDALAAAALTFGVRQPYHVLHPSLMYTAFEPYFNDEAGLQFVRAMTDYAPIPKLALPAGCPVPPKFVAVKFYARHTFPYPDVDIADFVKQITATLAAQAPVIVLQSADAYDDHADIAIVGANITSVGAEASPEQNLFLQAAILSHAVCFVGTYGGVAQTALRFGVASVSFYREFTGIGHAHFALNSWLSKQTGIPFLTGSLADAHLWSQLLSVPARIIAKPAAPVPEVVV